MVIAKWKSRLFDGLFWAAFGLVMIYDLPLWIALPLIILPLVGLLYLNDSRVAGCPPRSKSLICNVRSGSNHAVAR